jgi:hypothetical protein
MALSGPESPTLPGGEYLRASTSCFYCGKLNLLPETATKFPEEPYQTLDRGPRKVAVQRDYHTKLLLLTSSQIKHLRKMSFFDHGFWKSVTPFRLLARSHDFHLQPEHRCS